MDNEGSNDMDNAAAIAEPIEISVISIDTVQDMLIVQPGEMNQADTNSSPNHIVQPANIEINNPTVESSNEADVTPSRKKRKRSQTRKSDSPMKLPPPLDNEDDDGQTCSICLDSWEYKGDHRLVALKCGHLFGESCILRWIRECPTTSKCCPTCKAKATKNDLRKLYAKRVVVLDKTEEYRLKKLCDEERAKNADLQTSLSAIKLELAVCKGERAHFESQLNQLRKNGTYLEAPHSSSHQNTMYKLSLHKNIDISQGGCRVMTYGRRIQTLILSTKSTNTLFPGYGVRFVSAYNFQPTVFFRMSQKEIRDLSLDKDEELLAAASQDVSAFVYSVTNNTPVVTITPPSSTKVWSTSFDKNRPRYLHLGTAQGTYVYDVRNCISYVQHLTTPNDYSAVIRIQSVPISNDFRFGGFIVCKLKSLWFYEYTSSERIEQTRLMVEASFSSINFDEHTNTLFIETRTSSKNPHSRLIVANLLKIDQSTVLKVVCEIKGSTLQPQMLRGTQINIGNDSLISNYLQDTKTLGLWNAKTSFKMYGFNVDDCILDLCPMTVNNSSYLAGLSENKCRIFQINSI